MSHSGSRIINLSNEMWISSFLKEINFGIYGHEHGGSILNSAHVYLPTSYGLMSARGKLFSKNVRGVIGVNGFPFNVNGAVNLRIENKFLGPPYIFVLNIVPSKELEVGETKSARDKKIRAKKNIYTV